MVDAVEVGGRPGNETQNTPPVCLHFWSVDFEVERLVTTIDDLSPLSSLLSSRLKVAPGVSLALLQIWISGLLYPTIELK